MAVFGRKTCADYVDEIRRRLEIIASYPDAIPSRPAGIALVSAARAQAKRVRTILKKISALNQKASSGMHNALLLIESADTLDKYAMIKPQAALALKFFEDIESACRAKLVSKRLKRGKTRSYGRMMTINEFRRLSVVGILEAAEEDEMIPAFEAPPAIVDYFMKIDKTAVRNIYALIGGTGSVDYVLFFRTSIVPTTIGPPRRWPKIIEVKFPHGTPVEIFQVRRV
ncbi:MAG: hypothetical protein QXM31_02360 [Candidatus Woesearchaeota archaeon]